MEELEKVATPMAVREYLSTLNTEDFAHTIICAVSNINCRYMDTELDAFDIAFIVEHDMIEWLNSPYYADKELSPNKNIKIKYVPFLIDEDEFDSEDLDD